MRITKIQNDNISDVIEFKKLSYESFKEIYEDDIRISMNFNKLRNHNVTIHKVIENDILLYPWYDNGGWSDGKIRSFKYTQNVGCFDNMIVVRLPAIRIDCESFFIIDGTHRLVELKPGIIILDVLHLYQDDYRYVLDLYNEEFCNINYKKGN